MGNALHMPAVLAQHLALGQVLPVQLPVSKHDPHNMITAVKHRQMYRYLQFEPKSSTQN